MIVVLAGAGVGVATAGDREDSVTVTRDGAVPVVTEPRIGWLPDPVDLAATYTAGQARASAIEPLPAAETEPDVASPDAQVTTPSGLPGPGNTGVPAGTTLRASGSVTVSTDGQVIDGLNINGCVFVNADDVVIRNSRISCGVTYAIRTYEASNLVVEDTEIDGQGKIPVAVCCTDYTLRRVEVTNSVDGPRLGDNTVVEDSWIHNLARLPGTHNDTLQTTGASNIVVRGNTLQPYHAESGDPMNACLMIGSTTAPLVSNLRFEQNYCDGGNYSIGVRTDLTASNVQLRDNTFGRNHRYGVIARPSQSGITWDHDTNVYRDSLLPVVE
jgi:hypothetical protein